MSPRSRKEHSVVADFLSLCLADKAAGGLRSIAEYQQLFPGHEDLVAAELAALSSEPGTESEETGLLTLDSVGPYRIEKELGRGGQGVVYLATDTRLRRRVALKILVGLGADSSRMLERFRREAFVASRLDHPGICAVYEAGEADGIAYIAMRFLEGETLARGIGGGAPGEAGVQNAARIFDKVARALHAAHEAGVVHRDIKPGNIMLSPNGDPVLMDFGLARELEGGRQTLTESGDFFGTPAYMAPELLETEHANNDPRVDVWALGVSLYESLVGSRPFRATTRERLYRAILTEEFPDLRSGGRNIPRDVEIILQTALEKDPDRRYQTALDFADDLRRFLDDEPIQARPPSMGYRVQKFVRRNKALVGGVLGVVVALILGIIGTSIGFASEQGQRQLAEGRLRRVEVESARAVAVNKFLTHDVLGLMSPQHGEQRAVTTRQLLDMAAARIDGRFREQPLVEASIRMTIGHLYHQFSELAAAESQLVRSLELFDEHGSPEDADRLEAVQATGSFYLTARRLDEAEQLLAPNLDISRRVHGNGHRVTLALMATLATTFERRNRFAAAESLHVELLAHFRATRGDDDVETAGAMARLGRLRGKIGKSAEAEELLRDSFAVLSRELTREHPNTLSVMTYLAQLFLNQSRYREAESLFDKVLRIQRRVLGEDRRATLITMGSLALVHMQQGRHDKAEQLFRRTLELQRAILPEDHPDVLAATEGLASTHAASGRPKKAEPLLTEILEIRLRVSGEMSRPTATTMANLAGVKRQLGDLEQSGRLLAEVWRIRKALLGENSSETLASLVELGRHYTDTDRLQESERLLEEAVRKTRGVLPRTHIVTGKALFHYGRNQTRRKRFDAAEKALLAALEILEPKLSATHALVRRNREELATLYDDWKKPGKAAEYRASDGDGR